MKKAKRILAMSDYYIDQEKDQGGGSWGTFTVNGPGFGGASYYNHINAAIEKLINETGFEFEDIETKLTNKEDYRLLDHEDYKEKMENWNNKI